MRRLFFLNFFTEYIEEKYNIMIGFNLKYINFKKNQRLPVSLKTQKEPV